VIVDKPDGPGIEAMALGEDGNRIRNGAIIAHFDREDTGIFAKRLEMENHRDDGGMTTIRMNSRIESRPIVGSFHHERRRGLGILGRTNADTTIPG
jgi:hypothetical protein